VELIQLKGVAKEYSKNSILQNVNLTIEQGDMLGIIGASGSGKTTLLNLITGYIQPSAGDINFYSKVTQQPRNLAKNLHKIKKYIGFTPQHNAFYPKLSVKENLFHFGKLYGINKKILVANCKSLLEFTHLMEHRNKLAEHLSEGMQRRLDIACSLVHKPKLVVLDEPTADLDPVLQSEILSLLQQVNKAGVTIVLASHHLDSVEDVCNKVAIVHNGQVQNGLLDDVKRPFLKENVTISLRPGSNKDLILKTLAQLPVEKIVDRGSQVVIYPKDIEVTVSKLLQLIKSENLYLNDLDVRKPSLNEIFEQIARK
jgi:ABC-2 type transport system ATP-binding protein